MKFPTLSRLFSIVLALFSAVLIFTGIYGYISAKSDKEEADYTVNLLYERISTYEEYTEKLSNKEKYSDASARYDEEKSEYDDQFAEHRTDLGIYTATKGGLEDGKRQLEEADRKLYESYQELLEKREEAYATAVAKADEAVLANVGFSQDELQSNRNSLVEQINSLTDLISANEQIIVNSDAIINSGASSEDQEEQAEIDAAVYQAATDKAVAEAVVNQSKAALSELNNQLEKLDMAVQAYVLAEEQAKAAVDAQIQPYLDQISAGSGQIWWAEQEIKANQDKLEDDREELEQEKEELDKENERLAEVNAQNEQLKADENKLESTRILLEANDNIKAQVDDGMDIITAAKNESGRFEVENAYFYKIRLIISGILFFAAICGIMTVPCAFEGIKSHVLLIILTVLFILSCAAVQYLSYYLGRGNMYSAIVSGIFGIIALVFFIPKSKIN